MADVPVSAELFELDDDLRRVLAELATSAGQVEGVYARAFQPPIDVVETSTDVEVVVDVSGVAPEALRVVFRGNLLVVAGAKPPARTSPAATFHLVEREFGRFARAVRLGGAFDVPRARATVVSGELTVLLPKRADRRGQAHAIPVTSESPTT